MKKIIISLAIILTAIFLYSPSPVKATQEVGFCQQHPVICYEILHHITPTVTPTPDPCDYDEWQECITPTPTEEVTPTETPVPTETPEVTPTPEPVFSGESDGNAPGVSTPTCTDGSTTKDAANPLVWRKGDQAIVQWIPTDGTSADIFYKQVSSPVWQYSLLDQPNNGYVIINGLGNLSITFAIMQKNGCGGGLIDPAVTIVDNATMNGWHLFLPR